MGTRLSDAAASSSSIPPLAPVVDRSPLLRSSAGLRSDADSSFRLLREAAARLKAAAMFNLRAPIRVLTINAMLVTTNEIIWKEILVLNNNPLSKESTILRKEESL
jgi:hypothetical protein